MISATIKFGFFDMLQAGTMQLKNGLTQRPQRSQRNFQKRSFKKAPPKGASCVLEKTFPSISLRPWRALREIELHRSG
ncbi:MAG: hypothetical protein ACLQSR_13890 [Limisphaerales bacterium]